jgi:hypothetical protein
MQQRFGGDRKRGGLGQIFRTKRHAGKREAVSEVGTPRQLIADYFGDIQRARHEHTDDGRAARRVGRDVKAVHADIQTLLACGVLDKTDDGKIVFPFDAVHVDFAQKDA